MDDFETAMSPEDFCRAGEEIHGPEWHRAIARTLGAHHPGGPVPSIDDRLVRRWITGARAIPGWVPGALIGILGQQELSLRGDADRVAGLMAHLQANAAERKTQAGAQPGGDEAPSPGTTR